VCVCVYKYYIQQLQDYGLFFLLPTQGLGVTSWIRCLEVLKLVFLYTSESSTFSCLWDYKSIQILLFRHLA
jgi:hypothetical protein